MTKLPERIAQSIRERKLLPPGAAIVVAVSGGADSMVLLQLLHALSGANRWRLFVAHFNHRLRGRSSDADERLVRRTAQRLRLKCTCGAGEVAAHAQAAGVSIEMAARELRHEFLAKAAARVGSRIIALAHHQDDQAELFFLRLFRGAGAEGLAGMRWRSPSPADARVRLVRPLLDVSRTELLAYAATEKIRFREDASNAATDALRNRMRHELLPLIRRRFAGDIGEKVARVMDILSAESELLDAQSRRWLATGQPAFARLSVALQRRVIQLQLHALRVPVEFDLVERLRRQRGRKFTATGGRSLTRGANGRVQPEESLPPDFQDARQELKLSGRTGIGRFGGISFQWKLAQKRGCKFRKARGVENFDAAKIGQTVVLRHWQPGDRFRPLGLGHEVKLQDWFTNRKIPRARRHALVVATTAEGSIFWVEDQRLDERFKLTDATADRLVWRWQRR